MAEIVSKNNYRHTSVEELLKDYELLNAQLKEIKINWSEVAEKVGSTRDRVYHWYYETHGRHLAARKISKQERVAMQQYILNGIKTREIEQPTFQSKMKQDIFKDEKSVNRAEFSMIFNNLLRTKPIKARLTKNKIVLPCRRKTEVEYSGDQRGFSYMSSYTGSLTQSLIISPQNETATPSLGKNIDYSQMHDLVSQQLLQLQKQ